MIYELESENLTKLGGPMGTERTSTNWRKFFNSIDNAKKFAQKDYNKNSKREDTKLKWTEEEDHIRTDDMGFVMYYIRVVKTED